MELFRAGKQTDSAGNSHNWTVAELDEIVSNFKEDVPATLGHKVNDKPAFAWFKKLWREGNVLFGEMGEIVDEFGVMLKNKMFKNRSIALRADNSLRHVAFLGAEAPAVKGLEGFAFAEDDSEFNTFDFSEGNDDNKPSFMDNLKSALNILNISFNEPTPEDTEMSELTDLQAEMKTLTGKFAEQDKKIETLTGEVKTANEGKKTAEKEFSEYKEGESKNAIIAFADKMVADKKMLPADKDSEVAMMVSIDGLEAHDFSEGEGTKKKSPLQKYQETIEAREVILEEGEQFKEGTPRADDAGKNITAIVKKNAKENGTTFSEELKIYNEENPTLIQKIA